MRLKPSARVGEIADVVQVAGIRSSSMLRSQPPKMGRQKPWRTRTKQIFRVQG
jgi:hypothetical protein